MHERSLVRALLKQLEDLAAEYVGSRVAAVRVQVGELSGVESALLASAYDELVEETPLRDSTLMVERVPLQATCEVCGERFRIERYNFRCNRCGSPQLSLRGGEELLLESVTMEDWSHES
jgi:hydrogenase nickel incorporation protein HypA/HybF